MANISGTSNESIFQIKQWYGLNQNPDGDTKIKLGEASVMRNFQVTRDGNLRKRKGTQTHLEVGTGTVMALWSGYIGDERMVIIAVCDSKALLCYDNGEWLDTPTVIGQFGQTVTHAHIFGFGGNVYFLTGNEYKCWNGTTFATPTGYRPLVAISIPPNGGGETLEGVNKLNGLRRVWISPDGTGTVWNLPEKNLASIDAVKSTATGEAITGYTSNLTEGTVTFTTAPDRAVNSIEIQYSVSTDFSSTVKGMKYAELFNGTQDTRVFLYGDGTNKAIYSGVDYDGNQRGDYFPDLNEMKIGDDNTPITAMIRHYKTLLCYKTNSSWAISSSTLTDAEGLSIAAFYVTPLNRTIGNEAPGQVRLVLNSPYTLFGSDVYEWKNNASYSSNLSIDERQAKRISDRIYDTLREFNIPKCFTFDDNYNQEYYIMYGMKALVHNYAADAWYLYDNIDMYSPLSFDGEMYFGTTDGRICKMSYDFLGDEDEDGVSQPIDCYWESGSMAFGQDYQRKYSAMLWIGVKPESKSSVDVTVETDRTNSETEKTVSQDLLDFGRIDFATFTFAVNDKPQMKRLKIKAKKFVFYKLILKNNSNDTTTTVTSADIRVRFTGLTK